MGEPENGLVSCHFHLTPNNKGVHHFETRNHGRPPSVLHMRNICFTRRSAFHKWFSESMGADAYRRSGFGVRTARCVVYPSSEESTLPFWAWLFFEGCPLSGWFDSKTEGRTLFFLCGGYFETERRPFVCLEFPHMVNLKGFQFFLSGAHRAPFRGVEGSHRLSPYEIRYWEPIHSLVDFWGVFNLFGKTADHFWRAPPNIGMG